MCTRVSFAGGTAQGNVVVEIAFALEQPQPVPVFYPFRRWIMKSRCCFALLVLPALVFAGLAFAQAPQPGNKTEPGDKAKAERAEIAAAIKRSEEHRSVLQSPM